MDNPNNPNSPTNPNSTSPFGGPLQTPPTPTQPEPPAEPGPMPPPPPPPPFPSPVPSWPPVPEPVVPAAEPAPLPVTPPVWPQDPTQTNPGAGLSDLSSAWAPPASVQPEPTTPTQPELTVNPWSSPQTSTWTPPAPSGPEPILQPDLPLANPTPAQSEPTPTFTPPAESPTGGTSEPPSVTSPLNNPWGETPATPTQPSWMTSPTETAPTDLSHLISGNQQESTHMPAAESLVVPSAGVNPEVPNLPTETHKGIPKWLIGLSVGLLIIVLGASAYFILGIGQPSKGTTSLPAATTPQTSQVKPPLPIATPSTQPSASSSANFGQLGGAPPATSAADLIRQRQQGR